MVTVLSDVVRVNYCNSQPRNEAGCAESIHAKPNTVESPDNIVLAA